MMKSESGCESIKRRSYTLYGNRPLSLYRRIYYIYPFIGISNEKRYVLMCIIKYLYVHDLFLEDFRTTQSDIGKNIGISVYHSCFHTKTNYLNPLPHSLKLKP